MPLNREIFNDEVVLTAASREMPALAGRFVFFRGIISALPAEESREKIEGKDPVTGRPVMDELFEGLTKPLTAEEQESGVQSIKEEPRLLPPDTEENLHRLFLDNYWTDGMPIVLPTEERVAEMLTGTSHSPDEVVGKCSTAATPKYESTVEKVAVAAVMAGAEPKHLPVILALASSGRVALGSSTEDQGQITLINGPYRHEVGLNCGIGAMSPCAQANAVIGRAWNLLSRTCGGGAIPGLTFLATQGTPLMYNEVCIGENEEASPWEPFHVTQGYQRSESVVSIFWGRAMNHGNADTQIGTVMLDKLKVVLGGLSPGDCTLLLDPLVVERMFREFGFETKEDLKNWIVENVTLTIGEWWVNSDIISFTSVMGQLGTEPYATYITLPDDVIIPRYFAPDNISVVVLGGGTNAFYKAFDYGYRRSYSIDEWM